MKFRELIKKLRIPKLSVPKMQIPKIRLKTRSKSIIYLVVAIFLESLFITWPAICAINGDGFITGFRYVDNIVGLVFGLSGGITFGLVYGLLGGAVFGLAYGLSVGLGYGIAVGLIVGIVGGIFGGAFAGIVFGGVGGLGYGFSTGFINTIVYGPKFGLISGLFVMISVAIGAVVGSIIGVLTSKLLEPVKVGFTTTMRGFLRPWELKKYPFISAIASFFLAYLAVILLFGLWFYSCHLEGWDPKPYFNSNRTDYTTNLQWIDFIYFSSVTISTLGYGDIFPLHWLPKILVLFEMVAGIVLVAGYFVIILQVWQRTQDQMISEKGIFSKAMDDEQLIHQLRNENESLKKKIDELTQSRDD